MSWIILSASDLNPLTDDKIVDGSKMKHTADDILQCI